MSDIKTHIALLMTKFSQKTSCDLDSIYMRDGRAISQRECLNCIPPVRMTIAINTMTSSSKAIGSTPITRSFLTIVVMPAPRINLRLTVLCFM